jgi:hypothetical protein
MELGAKYTCGSLHHTSGSMLKQILLPWQDRGRSEGADRRNRLSDRGKRSEHKKFFPIITGTTTAQTYAR